MPQKTEEQAAEPRQPLNDGKRKADETAEPRNGKARLQEPEDDDDDDECMEVEAPGPSSSALRPDPLAGAAANDDDEVQVTGRTGMNALCDFPHARFNCVAKPFVLGKEQETCSQCYCFVCDGPANGCPRWPEHCMAKHGERSWEEKRIAWRQRAAQPLPAPVPAPGGASSSAALSAAPSAAQPVAESWSCDQMLAAIQQVYPVELPEPAGLLSSISLRPYQKQSLAFMIALENDTGGLAGRRSTEKFIWVQKQYRREELRNPNGANWDAPTWTTLEPTAVTGGWLCDEMGMGKTAVVTALALARPSSAKPRDDAVQLRLKCTLVVCNNTLVQQWEDEVKKFAPALNVQTYYSNGAAGAAKRKESTMRNLRVCDVLITTPHMNFGADLKRRMHFHRLVVDESHLLDNTTAGTAMPLALLMGFSADHLWCVTGTPFSTSLSQLMQQAFFLGQLDAGIQLRKLSHACKRDPAAHQSVVDQLRRVMIRHTKAMRLGGGDVALALPEKDVRTIWLDMSDDERLLYQVHSCDEGRPAWVEFDKHMGLGDLGRGIEQRRNALSHLYRRDVAAGFTCNVSLSYMPGRIYNSIDAPSTAGRYPEAAAAYLRLHETKTVDVLATDNRGKPLTDVLGKPKMRREEQSSVRLGLLTKAKRLVADLKELLQDEPDMRVAIFTEHNTVQAQLKEFLGTQGPWGISEFNQRTPPLKRHQIIKDFQASSNGGGAKLFVATFSVAAVGITLTAATRIFLFEPSLDPATEAQAAGRIHRLGQQHEVHVHKYAFRRSLDEAVVELHAKIAAGEVSMRDGKFPPEALAIFRTHGVAFPHELSGPAREQKEEFGAGHDLTCGRRYFPLSGRFGRTFKQQQCACCAQWQVVPNSSLWWGHGDMAWINGKTDDRAPKRT